MDALRTKAGVHSAVIAALCFTAHYERSCFTAIEGRKPLWNNENDAVVRSAAPPKAPPSGALSVGMPGHFLKLTRRRVAVVGCLVGGGAPLADRMQWNANMSTYRGRHLDER